MTPEEAKERTAMYAAAQRLYGTLHLPACELRLRGGSSGKPLDVYDPMRRRWVALTPEEWVRQHFVDFMIKGLGFSAMRIANEVPLKLNGTARRADTVAYDDNLRPMVIVEYKAPDIKLTRETLEQALRYNLVFDAPGLMITNGMDVYSVLHDRMVRGVIARKDLG